MRRYRTLIFMLLIAAIIAGLFVYGRYLGGGSVTGGTFVETCLADGNMWHTMAPRRNGVEIDGEERAGCMTADGANHFSSYDEYRAAKEPGDSTVSLAPGDYQSGTKSTLTFSIRSNGEVPVLFKQHERYLHVIIISKDKKTFAHIHPDDQPGFDEEDVRRGEFQVDYTFERGGEYLIAVDYANQLKHESKTFRVDVKGSPQGEEAQYPLSAEVSGLTIALSEPVLFADREETVLVSVLKDGTPVTLMPYLGAAMHVAVVKNDLTEFIHAHGEVHVPGSTGKVLSHVHAPPPASFTAPIELHVVIPEPGLYTLFSEIQYEGTVIRVPFTVRVE